MNRLDANLIIANAPDPVFVSDLHGKILLAKEAVSDLLGFHKDEVLEQSLSRFVTLHEARELMGALREVVERGVTRNVRLHPHSASGEVIPTTLNTSALRGPDGEVIGVVGILRDMRELDKARAYAESLIKNAPDPVFVSDLALRGSDTARGRQGSVPGRPDDAPHGVRSSPAPAVEFGRQAGVALRVVADPGREDLVEPGHLLRGRRPRRVEPAIDRSVDRLEETREDPTLDGAAGHDPRRRVDREELRARARGTLVEDPRPDVITRGDQGPVGSEAAVDGRGRLVARHAALGVRSDVGHPFVDDPQRQWRLVELRAGRPRVREPDRNGSR